MIPMYMISNGGPLLDLPFGRMYMLQYNFKSSAYRVCIIKWLAGPVGNVLGFLGTMQVCHQTLLSFQKKKCITYTHGTV